MSRTHPLATHDAARHRRLAPVALACIASFLASPWAAAQTEPAAAAQNRLPEIVVTAQRISQLASKTALAITAVSGEELRATGTTTAVGLTSLAPNVLISAGSSASTDISIRGIVSSNTTEVGDPAAAFHIDGVYLGRPQSAGATFFDLQRIEVLRGPQGTLYGRNATAGAINLITNKPSNRFEGQVNATLGNYNLRNAEGMVNVPINDMLALRAVLSVTRRDGTLITAGAPNAFTKNRDDIDNQSARVHGLLKFNDSTRLLVTLDGSRNKGAGSGSVLLEDFQNGNGDARRTALGNRSEGTRSEKSTGLSAEFTTELGFAELTYLASRRTFDRDSTTSTLNPISFTLSNFTQTSHELRLASSGNSPLRWVAGLYAFNEEGDMDARFQFTNFRVAPTVVLPNFQQRFVQNPVDSSSRAVFGQATYSLTPQLRLTAGARTTEDEKSRLGVVTLSPPIAPNSSNVADVSYRRSTWKLGAEFDILPAVMVYGNVATGYKAGGYFDGDNARGDNTYKPESLRSVELGLKGRFLDNRLQLSAALFQYNYQDLQISYVTINPLTNATGTITTNAARATNRGAELEARWLVSDAGTLGLSVGLLDAKYKSFLFPVIPTRPVAIDYAGRKLDRAPETTLAVNYTHKWALADGSGLSANAAVRYSSSYVFSNFAIATPVQYTQAAFTRTDLSLTYASADDSWNVQAFVKNVGDRQAITGYSYSAFTGNQVFLSDPRTFGLRAGWRF